MTTRQPPPLSSWCEIHRSRISRNLELALGLVPAGAQFCAVLKADAYGHGIAQVVPLIQEQGVTCIGITSNAEARAVRSAGFTDRLIRLRAATAAEMTDAVPDFVEEQVGSLDAACHLLALRNQGKPAAGLHLSLNAAGMSRDGLEIATAQGQATCLRILEHIGDHLVGICSHFPSNEPALLRQSSELFQQQAAWVISQGHLNRSKLLIHAGSSLTLVSGENIPTDMYRCGAVLYGILKPELGFQPTMELKAHVVGVGHYPEGATVGYDRTARLDQDRRLACISIGYANGFRRNDHTKSTVVIGDKPARVVGKTSMNTIVADVTGMEDIRVGDEVIVFGGPGNHLSATAAEQQFHTIMADLHSDWGLRNHRIYS